MIYERLSLEGHLLDQNTLSEMLKALDANGVSFKIHRFRVGEFSDAPSIIEIRLAAETVEAMQTALSLAEKYGATYNFNEVQLATADVAGVLPEGFYSTTNFATHIRFQGQALEVENIEMDCGIRVWNDGPDGVGGQWRAETCPMHRVNVGDQLVVAYDGVVVAPAEEDKTEEAEFRFMSNEISSERPKGRMIRQAIEAMKVNRAAGKKTLFVGGPAIVHSGSAPMLAALIEHGWVNILFAGNALATHDIESNMLGTSLGVDLETGHSGPHGHTHHLRAINRVRRVGSITEAVRQGLITGGVMHTCVRKEVPFVLCGSIRDDGPLPDVITDNVAAQDAMRQHIAGVGVCLMVATMLHSVATGNMLPATVKTYCVDADADTVIKLTDRGTHQAVGIVTDCEFFLKELCLGFNITI